MIKIAINNISVVIRETAAPISPNHDNISELSMPITATPVISMMVRIFCILFAVNHDARVCRSAKTNGHGLNKINNCFDSEYSVLNSIGIIGVKNNINRPAKTP